MRLSRHAMWVGLACWLVFVGVFGVWTTASSFECGELTPGDSNYGEARWTWAPPGFRCEWSVGDSTHVEYPPRGRYFVMGAMGIFPFAVVAAARRPRQVGNVSA